MEKKLGKGLSALLGESSASVLNQSGESDPSFRDIQLRLIKPNPDQPRSLFNEEKIEELAQSLKSVGLIEPIIVKQEGAFYQIIAGERRFRAAQKANFETIPAIVKNETKKDLLEIMLIENIQREDLNPLEEALCYQQILENKRITQDELSATIGKSRSHISNHLRLLDLPEAIRENILLGKISMGHAKVLVNLSREEQEQYISLILDSKLSVRALEMQLKNISKKKDFPSTMKTSPSIVIPTIKNTQQDPFLRNAEDVLRDFFQTKVSIQRTKNEEGKIEISFFNNEDIEKIIERLNLE